METMRTPRGTNCPYILVKPPDESLKITTKRPCGVVVNLKKQKEGLHMFKNSRLESLFTLNHKLTVYVPSTVDIDKAIDNTQQVNDTARLLSGCFGGATSSPAVGYWCSPSAGLVQENTTVVFAYAAENALQENLNRIIDWCTALRNSMKQDAVALEIDGQMYFI